MPTTPKSNQVEHNQMLLNAENRYCYYKVRGERKKNKIIAMADSCWFL